MWTGILIYLYKWRAPCSLIVRNRSFSPLPKWFVLLLAVHRLDSFFLLVLFFLFVLTYFSPTSHPGKMLPQLCSPLRHCYWDDLFLCLCFSFDSSFSFCIVFVCFWFVKKTQTNQDRDKPAVVHAKMNCVKTKLVPLFFIFCNGLLLNISIYWYIKSEWKTLPCVLFVFV